MNIYLWGHWRFCCHLVTKRDSRETVLPVAVAVDAAIFPARHERERLGITPQHEEQDEHEAARGRADTDSHDLDGLPPVTDTEHETH